MRSLRQYGWEGKYKVAHHGGRNSRLDEMQAAIMVAKLPHLDHWNARRRAIAERYVEEIVHPGLICPRGFGTDNVAHLFVVRCEARDRLRAHLDTLGIGTDVHYPIPDHRQVAISKLWSGGLPVTDQLANEILTLPCFPELTEDEVTHIIRAVNAW